MSLHLSYAIFRCKNSTSILYRYSGTILTTHEDPIEAYRSAWNTLGTISLKADSKIEKSNAT